MGSDLGPVCSRVDGGGELRFARRGGRTVLAHSRVQAPLTLVRPFELSGGRQLVQLITLGPGFCGGDRVHLRITADAGADVVVTTTAATRVLSMHENTHAEQHVEILAARGATVQYYPLPTIPFPESAFIQTLTVHADADSRVGALEIWALGRTARGEYLEFRSLANRTSLTVNGSHRYTDVIELCPREADLTGVAVLAGRRYVASGFWHGATIADAPRAGASEDDVLIAFGQSRPGLAYLRALARDAPSLDAALRHAVGLVGAAWGDAALSLDRFRC
jgi:urease accessory protein